MKVLANFSTDPNSTPVHMYLFASGFAAEVYLYLMSVAITSTVFVFQLGFGRSPFVRVDHGFVLVGDVHKCIIPEIADAINVVVY